MDTEARNLVAFHGSRVPEIIGNFRLDDHNVEEWSNPSQPGMQHLARKEVGKWVDQENNADIQYQKREENKQSDRSKEKSRTEVIQGKAPDSTFQIVRSHRQFQDSDDKSGSRVQSTSTSYQMSSSRGVRSSSKTTSNKTTTKTVTVSGNRSDDFENLNMSFQPLDTSTQRERISVSRSGTMGVRRPPTRRHTPAALLSSSPEDDNPTDFVNDVDGDSDDHIGGSEHSKICDPSSLAIVGFKNISPKIRVGFPVEIQLELQTKLRCSSNGEREQNRLREKDKKDHSVTRLNAPPSTMNILSLQQQQLQQQQQQQQQKHQQTKEEHRQMNANESANALYSNNSSANNESSTFDFRQRRKSYGFESFDSHTKQSQAISEEMPSPTRHSDLTSNINSHKASSSGRPSSQFARLSPSSLSRSWDLIQSVASAQQKREANKKLFPSTSTMNISNTQSQLSSSASYHLHPPSSSNGNNYAPKSQLSSSMHHQQQQQTPKTTIITLNAVEDSPEPHSSQGFTLDSLESSPYPPTPNQNSYHLHNPNKINLVEEENESQDEYGSPYPPDGQQDSSPSPSSPDTERSRKLMQMLDGTPDLLNKMSFKNYFSSPRPSESGKMTWEEKDETDWEAQRQLSFLNDSLSRILDESRAIPDNVGGGGNSIFVKTATGSSNTGSFYRREMVQEAVEGKSKSSSTLVIDHEIDYNGNVKSPRQSQVSQTWISSGDQKPSQTVRDNDVITSISATQDAYRRGPKKVEFCKTEVHFTPDSGKFHIVETDENKPSTVHLFRRKKRGDKKSGDMQAEENDNYEAYLDGLELVNLVEDINSARTKASNYLNSKSDNRSSHEANSVVIGISENPLFQRWSDQEAKSVHIKGNNSENNGVQTSHQSNTSNIAVSKKESLSHHQKDILSEASLRKDLHLSVCQDKDDKDDELIEKNHLILDVDLDVDLDELNRDEESHSPSHMILSKYGELKIQRYLKQLKPPSSQAGSDSPTESLDGDDGNGSLNNFRFDNVLYENGSFVPMATRRSLIEMNNRNRKRNSASHTSDNSSTTSNYSLPNSDKDNSANYPPLKLTTMEATVETSGPKPQITSVELRYSLEKERPYNPEPIIHDQQELQFHSGVVNRNKRDKLAYIPSPVMPSELRSSYKNGRLSFSESPSTSSVTGTNRDSSSFRNAKPPTPILPVQFATFEKTGAALRERFYTKNPACACTNDMQGESESPINNNSNNNNNNNNHNHNHNHNNNNTISQMVISSSRNVVNSSTHGKGGTLSKSIVNIGGSSNSDSNASDGESPGTYHLSAKSNNTQENNDPPTGEPILSMDHTWKGPAHFEGQSNYKAAAVVRSMTFPKSARPEPEWVSKAKSRETRVTDWSLIGKQYGSSRKSEPPWISEIRFKTKPIPPEEMKSLPKISVVYPWQRDSSAPNSPPEYSSDNVDNDLSECEAESKILSVVPPPSTIQRLLEKQINNNTTVTTTTKDHRLYSNSKNHTPPLKSLKSVPEVSISKNASMNTNNSSHNKRLADLNRESDIIVINPSHQMSLHEDPINVTSKGMKSSKKSLDSGIATEHNMGSISMSTMASSTVMASSIGESEEMRDSSNIMDSLKSSRKPFQSHQATNTSSKNKNHGTSNRKQSSKAAAIAAAAPKPPKPPQRISSLLQSQQQQQQQQQLLQQKQHAQILLGEKKTHYIRRGVYGNSEVEESPSSSRSNTPTTTTIHHQHPTVKVSKLPIRTAPMKISSPESKNNSSSKTAQKSKQQVSLIMEAKRLCKPKSTDSYNPSNSSSKLQKESTGAPGGTSVGHKVQKSALKSSGGNNVNLQPSHKKR